MANQLTGRITLQGGAEVVETLRRIGVEGERSFKRLGGSINDVGKAIRDFGAGVSLVGAAISGAVIAVGALAKSGAEAADAVGKAAQKIGIGVEEFGKLKFAAEQNELTSEQLTTSLGKLTKTMDAAAKGSSAARGAFAQLGVEFQNSDGSLRNASEVLFDLSDAFDAMPDGANKAALALQLFGRSGADMIPLLNQGSAELKRLGEEATRLGLTFTAAEATIGDNFNDTLDALIAQITALKDHIGLQFAPIFTELFQSISDFIAAHKDTILGFTQGLIDTFSALPEPVQLAIGAITALTVVLGPILIALGVFVQVIGFAAAGLATLGAGFAGVLVSIVPWAVAFAAAAVACFKLGQAIGNLILMVADLDFGAVADAIVDAFVSAGQAIADVFRSAIGGAINFVRGLFEEFLSFITGTWVFRIIAAISSVISKLGQAKAAAGEGDGSGKASGGLIRGPGTSTSDSVPIWASNSEFMQPARAVRKYGLAFMESVRNLTFPGFADGGLIGGSAPAIASLAGVGGGAPRNVLNLTIGEREFAGMLVDDSTYDSLARYAAFQRLTSGGRKPGWYGS